MQQVPFALHLASTYAVLITVRVACCHQSLATGVCSLMRQCLHVALVVACLQHSSLCTAWLTFCDGCANVWWCSEAQHPAFKCPKIDHVVIAMMENRAATLLKTNPEQVKNIQAMIDKYSPATKYYGYTHPSEPNCKWRAGPGAHH